MFRNKSILLLLTITFLAAVLRFYKLDQYPVSLNWDEVSHGYNAYSILKTGRDEWGEILPFIFRGFGDYKLPVYIYLTIIPIFLFGLNAFAVRFISALAGTLAIPGIYLLTNSLFPDKKVKLGKIEVSLGHLAAFVLTLMPWHIFISRPALEANLALTLIIFGFYFLHRALQKSFFFIPASLLLGLSLHTYNTQRVFVPTLLFLFIIIFRNRIKINRMSLSATTIFLFFVSLVAMQVVSGIGTKRYDKLKILSENAVFQIGQNRLKSTLPQPLPTLIYNRPVYFATSVIKNYLSYFTPQFLYQAKGVQTQFAIPIKNLFSLPTTLLLLVGLIIALKHQSSSGIFILSWFFLAPLAASLTVDPPQALRPNPFIPAVSILAALGFVFLLDNLRALLKTAAFISIVSSLVFSTVRYLNTYYGDYAHYYSDSWQYGYQELFAYLKTVENNYGRIIITKKYGEPHIFYAFYNKLDPRELQPGKESIRFEKSDWFWTDKVSKYYFVNDWDIPERGEIVTKIKLESGSVINTSRSLLVTTFNRLPDNARQEKIIEFVDGRVAFIIASIP